MDFMSGFYFGHGSSWCINNIKKRWNLKQGRCIGRRQGFTRKALEENGVKNIPIPADWTVGDHGFQIRKDQKWSFSFGLFCVLCYNMKYKKLKMKT